MYVAAAARRTEKRDTVPHKPTVAETVLAVVLGSNAVAAAAQRVHVGTDRSAQTRSEPRRVPD